VVLVTTAGAGIALVLAVDANGKSNGLSLCADGGTVIVISIGMISIVGIAVTSNGMVVDVIAAVLVAIELVVPIFRDIVPFAAAVVVVENVGIADISVLVVVTVGAVNVGILESLGGFSRKSWTSSNA